MRKIAADRNYRMIKTAIGPSSHTAKVLRQYGLGEEYYINTVGDSYKYVYVPPEKGGPKFIITSGKINTSFFDSAGNATKTVSIRKGRPGYDNLIERLPDNLKPVEESPPQAQTGDLIEYSFKGWRKYMRPDGNTAYYIDDRGSKLHRPLSNTRIDGTLLEDVDWVRQ